MAAQDINGDLPCPPASRQGGHVCHHAGFGCADVSTFGQSVFSFKRFKDSIDHYRTWVIAYTIDLRLPMTLYFWFEKSLFTEFQF